MTVKRALEGLKGVQRAEVSFRDKEARVTFDPTQVTVRQLIAAVARSGFDASLKGNAERSTRGPTLEGWLETSGVCWAGRGILASWMTS